MNWMEFKNLQCVTWLNQFPGALLYLRGTLEPDFIFDLC
jgi:hypothetical protein